MDIINTIIQYPGVLIIIACVAVNIGLSKVCFDIAFAEETEDNKVPAFVKVNAGIGFAINLMIFALNFSFLVKFFRA